MESGRINPNNRYSDLAIKCHLLPGVPLPIYSAVTGEDTNEALKRHKAKAGEKAFFIGLVTGNWIRFRRTPPVCPVPLARGPGHLSFKQVLIDHSDEVYVISPLGKILVRVARDEINTELGYTENNPALDRKPYCEVNIDDNKAKNVKIVSTSRQPGCVLHPLSQKIQFCLEDSCNVSNDITSSELPQHIVLPFNKLPDSKGQQIEIEFPHPHTRREEFMRKFFFI